MTRRTITIWFLVHKWTSLISTLFLLMLCITGLPLIFHEEIDAVLDPPAPLAAVPAGTRPMNLDTLLAKTMAGQADAVPLYLSFDDERPVVYVTYGPTANAPESAMQFQTLDQRTGAVLPKHEGGVMDILLALHTDLMLGLTAELMLGAMGFLFFVAIVSGVVLYAPFMARLRFGTVRHDRSDRVRRLDRHNLLGIVTVAWASVVGLTGTINTLAIPLTNVWKADQLATVAMPGASVAPVRAGSVQAALDTAQRAAPGMRPLFIAFPGVAFSSNRHIAIFFQGNTPLTAKLLTPALVDARTGRLDMVAAMPWYMQSLLLAQPLHFGDYAGLPMKILWAILDVMTIAVLVTGLRLWLGRRSGTASARVREVLEAGEPSAPVGAAAS